MDNKTIIQLFHWYIADDGNWWNYCASQAKYLADLGFTHVYLPPAYKSAFEGEPGYAVYDLYDLGEFDQKGKVRTKYGTKEEYLRCIEELHKNKLSVIADVVMNHRNGADEEELFKARAVDHENRNEFAGEETEIHAFTKFTFPARHDKYSSFKWDFRCFSGVDKFENGGSTIYSILNEYGDKWEDVLADEFGNYDFLMGADVEFRNEYVREELKNWGKWYIETTKVDGFRLDAVKHITPSFIKEWVNAMKDHFKRDFFCIAEFWNFDVNLLFHYLDTVENCTALFDVPLHHNFYQASLQRTDYDMTKLLDGTLFKLRSFNCITFVDNHDTQPLQALESPVDFWFKPIAYAIILLREQGIPTVFFPALYGASYSGEKGGHQFDINLGVVQELETLLKIRKDLAYGLQIDYMDHGNVIGWVRQGIKEKPNSGCAVVISNGDNGFKTMDMGKDNSNKIYLDACSHVKNEIKTDENGHGTFEVNAGSVSVWIEKKK